MENISDYLSYAEATQTNTGLPNIPSKIQLMNIKQLADNLFEPLRAHVGKPIKVNSVFRSFAVNNKVGGSLTSQHCANSGAAMDIVLSIEDFNWLIENLDFDQAILEPSWVHISYKWSKNRKQVLKATKSGDKMIYSPYIV